jgi:chloramphenicol 3-O-phosphotransferase
MFLTEPNIILINGVSNSGKSFLLKSFLDIAIKKKYIQKIMVLFFVVLNLRMILLTM